MPTLTEEDVFTFEQLSDSAKDKARQWMRDCEMQDFDTEFMFEDFGLAAGILGIELNQTQNGTFDIRWSGFSSQGDGASFVGSYSNAPGASVKIREDYPEETGLHAIADGLTALQVGYRLSCGKFISASITQDDNHYCHARTMDICVSEGEDEDVPFDGDGETRLLKLMRDFADWMYKSLEEEWDYRLSDECIDEYLKDGDYEFDEDGELV